MSELRYLGDPPPGSSHYFGAFGYWLFAVIAVQFLGLVVGPVDDIFAPWLGAVILLLSRPEGVRGWLVALATALLVSAVALGGSLFAHWCAEALELTNDGVLALLHLPAAILAVAMSLYLVRAQDETTGGKGRESPPPRSEPGFLGFAVFFVVTIITVVDLTEEFQRMVLSLGGYDAKALDIESLFGIVVLATGVWLLVHWKHRPARYAMMTVALVVMAVSPLTAVAGPWLAEKLAADPDAIMNHLIQTVPEILLLALWMAAMIGLAHRYGLNRDDDETPDRPAGEKIQP